MSDMMQRRTFLGGAAAAVLLNRVRPPKPKPSRSPSPAPPPSGPVYTATYTATY